MSRRERRRQRLSALLGVFALCTATGCWEQWSETWFPQMKWQKTVQAYERVEFRGQIEGFQTPEGTVPVGGAVPSFERFDPAVDTLTNPFAADWKSLQKGQQVYQIYCLTCHGETGMGNGPVSMTYPGKPGPLAGVFPLVTAMSRSDGYVYNLVRNGGGRMPGYRRIPDEERWHLVNYVRYLQRGGQP